MPPQNDKWMKDRLDTLQSEMFEYSTQTRMGFEDLAELVKGMQGRLSTLERENSTLKTKLAEQESRLNLKIGELRRSMTAPRKIVRDENGMISRVEVEDDD
jgi:hypothetical protein